MQDYIPRKKDINGNIETVTVKQFDCNSRFLHVTLSDADLTDGDSFNMQGCTAALYIQPEGDDDPTKVNYVKGEIADPEGGIVTFLLPGGVTQVPGRYECEIWIYHVGDQMNSVISTKPFLMIVEKSIRNDSAIEATQDMSALDEKIVIVEGMRRDVEELVDSMEATATRLDRIIDSHAYVKPVFMSEISGYAAQSMIVADHTVDGDIYLIGFSKDSDASKSLLMAYNAETNTILSSAEFPFGHANSMAIDSDGVIYLPNDDGKSIYRFTVTSFSGNLTINQLDPAAIPTGWFCKDIFSHDGTVYANGTHEAKQYYWALGEEGTAVEIPLPDEMPRVSQSWSTDGRYLYVLRSSPNAVAVYDFASGEFIRWVEIGDYIGVTYPIGEIETICVNSNQEMMLLSQLYYDLPNKNNRFWLLSKLKPSSDMPEDQQHKYPGEELVIYVSNANNGKIAFVTNPDDPQSGSVNYPYPSLESALYAATASASNKVKIIMKNTGTNYVIDYLSLNFPLLDIWVQCSGNVTFNYLELKSGKLNITGNATFEKIVNSPNSSLSIDGGTYSEGKRINDSAPYQLCGNLALINSKFTGTETITEDNVDREIPSTQTVFQFNSGSTGVVGFTAGSPRSNSTQQLNLTLYNVRNAGGRDRWTSIYSGGTAITIGTAITTTLQGFNVLTDTIYRIRWRAESDGGYYNTIVHVNGDTIVDMPCMITVDGRIIHRIVRMRFRPRVQNNNGNWINGDITVISVTDYTISGGAIAADVTSTGAIPNTTTISAIDVRGY